MTISLNDEQTATRQAWLQTLKVGDPLVVFYNWCEKDGRIDAVVVQHDHGWIRVVPRNKKDTPSNRIKYCEVSGKNPSGYGDLLPPDMVVFQEESDAIRADWLRRDRVERQSGTRKMQGNVVMMVRDLSERALDWAVGQALHKHIPGDPPTLRSFLDGMTLSVEAIKNFSPTSDIAMAQALIQHEGVRIEYYECSPKSGWDEYSAIKGDSHFIGATAEIAGLRCIVGAKFGNEIGVPRELVPDHLACSCECVVSD